MEKFIKDIMDLSQDRVKYIKYIKNHIAKNTSEKLEQENFINHILQRKSILNEKDFIGILNFMEKENKLNYLQRITEKKNLYEYLLSVPYIFNDSFDISVVQKEIDYKNSLNNRITLTEFLKIIKEVKNLLTPHDVYAVQLMFRSNPYLSIYSKKKEYMDVSLFYNFEYMDSSSKIYVLDSERVEELMLILIDKLELKGIYDYSEYKISRDLNTFKNKISVKFRENRVLTKENLIDLIELNPFRNNIWLAADIKILKDVFYKKVLPEEWERIVNEIESENMISIKRNARLNIKEIHIKEKSSEKTILEKLESEGKLKCINPSIEIKEYKFNNFSIFDHIKTKLVKEGTEFYIKIEYNSLRKTRIILSDMDMWEDFQNKVVNEFKNKFSKLEDYLNIKMNLHSITFFNDEEGYFKAIVDFKRK